MENSCLINNLVSDRSKVNLFVDLTKQSVAYFSDRVLKKDSVASREKLECSLRRDSDFKGVNAHDFARDLVMYLYNNRRR